MSAFPLQLSPSLGEGVAEVGPDLLRVGLGLNLDDLGRDAAAVSSGRAALGWGYLMRVAPLPPLLCLAGAASMAQTDQGRPAAAAAGQSIDRVAAASAAVGQSET